MKRLLLTFIGLGFVFGGGAAQAQTSSQAIQTLHLTSLSQSIGPHKLKLEVYGASKQNILANSVMKDLGLWYQKHKAEQRRLVLGARRKNTPLNSVWFSVFQEALKLSELSKGAFQLSSEPLFQVWGFEPLSFQFKKPPAKVIQKALEKVNDRAIQLEEVPPHIYFKDSKLDVAFRYFERGWLIDHAVALLRSRGISIAAVTSDNMGYYMSSPPGSKGWKVPLPRLDSAKSVWQYYYLKNQAFVQLSHTQEYFTFGGISYSNLLDSRTGYPTTGGDALAVISTTTLKAELLAHTLIHLKPKVLERVIALYYPIYVFKVWKENGLQKFKEYKKFS